MALAAVLASTLLLTAAAVTAPAPASAASGCHLINNIGWDRYNAVETFYTTSFCTSPRTVNYIAVTVRPVSIAASNWVIVYDIYITRNISTCDNDTGYIIRHAFSTWPGWQIMYPNQATYDWNIYAPVDFSGNPYVCIRYWTSPGDIHSHSNVLPFAGY